MVMMCSSNSNTRQAHPFGYPCARLVREKDAWQGAITAAGRLRSRPALLRRIARARLGGAARVWRAQEAVS